MTFLPASMRIISMHWSITGRNLCSRSSIRAIRNMIFGETIRSLPGFLLSWVPVIRTLLPAVMAGTSLQKNLWVNTGYNVRKFLVSKTVSPEYNTNPANFVIYRYADVLLKKAEALNEMGRPDQAAVPLNIVRKRAGLPEVSGLSQETMREKIIHERRMELAFEGHRWFDMIRVNNGEYAIKFLHSIGKSNVNKNRLLFPIPQTEMDANTLMVQNPGY